MRALSGRPPALWLGLAALLGLLIALATAAPPAVTLRGPTDLGTVIKVPVGENVCTNLSVLPKETTAIRAVRADGVHVPEQATLAEAGGRRSSSGRP